MKPSQQELLLVVFANSQQEWRSLIESFYRAFNAIFGKVGRVASEDVVMDLLKTKCLPILYYGFEACTLNKSQIHSLEFALNSCLRKIFNTRSQDVVVECLTAYQLKTHC